ncbi:hypothetical protein Taro_017920 [Colocasia esculenta]|uniref:Pentatricopeptide repeat-containing protein n=1 Tax=Colocasia esculenta TaxID=4460 RepID=A0A843UUQ2_COLES|nr:hypothetical protein [Colocasia esculenta]
MLPITATAKPASLAFLPLLLSPLHHPPLYDHPSARLYSSTGGSTSSNSAVRRGSGAAEEDASDPSSLIARLVLSSKPGDHPRDICAVLSAGIPPSVFHHLSPDLVDRVLKRLWNDAPRALLFFRALLLLRRPAASNFDHALDLAARLGDRRAVGRLLSLRLKLRVAPTPRTFAILMERHAAAGKPDRAVRLFLSMHRHGCKQDLSSFNTLLDVLCKSRRVEKAQQLFRALRGRFQPDAVTYNIVADGWCLLKCTSRALETLKEMVSSGLEPTVTTYNILLKGYFRSGQEKEAWAFFLQMKKRSKEGSNCKPDVVSYTTVVHGLGLAGHVDRARKVFDEMIREGCLPSVATYNALIQVTCKKDIVKNALVLFDEMRSKGYTPNSTTFNLVIRGLCHSGEMDKAMELMEQMKCEECEPNVQTYNIVIRHWCAAGEMDKGLDLYHKMGGATSGCLPNMDTYNLLISAMFIRRRAEDMLAAGQLLVEMVERGYLPRRFTFNRILNGLLLTGNQAFAKEILRVQSSCGRLPPEVRL